MINNETDAVEDTVKILMPLLKIIVLIKRLVIIASLTKEKKLLENQKKEKL